MYKCPKCGSQDTFSGDADMNFIGWVEINAEGKIVDMEELDRRQINDFDFLGNIRCNECDYEGPEDEFI